MLGNLGFKISSHVLADNPLKEEDIELGGDMDIYVLENVRIKKREWEWEREM